MNTYDTWIEKEIYDANGDHVGEVENLYVDTETHKPTWLHVETGFFGTKYTYIPIESTYADSDKVVTDYKAEFIKEAPHFDENQILSTEEEALLYEYYSLEYKPLTAADADVADDNELVRAEEEAAVGTREVNRGTVRLHKYVVTEDVDLTVPVRKEKVRVVRTPVDGDVELDDLEETVAEVTVSEEVPVVEKKVVAKEKISLEKDVEVEDATIETTLKKEVVDVDKDVD